MEIRYFAGAAEAAGQDTTTLDAAGLSAQDVVQELGGGNESLERVLQVSSLLADGVRVTDLGTDLSEVKKLDVLPPFAGG